MNIAIDGPAGAGKSTIAKLAAKGLGFLYVDTGAMYRAIGLYLLENEVDYNEESQLLEALDKINIEIKYVDGVQRVILNDRDVSEAIRREEVGQAASTTSALKPVRAKLLDLQRDIAAKNDVIMDGRDIGTNILPNAELKIYLTASVEVRAQRRYKELVEKGMDVNYEDILSDVKTRDYNDSHRETAPLKPAEGCVIVDTTELDFEQSVEKIISVIKENI